MSNNSLKLAAAVAFCVAVGLGFAPIVAFVASHIAHLAQLVGGA